MRIGILTFHFACNYGAVLQCFALQRFLSSCGHEVEVLDYRPSAVADGYRWFYIRRFWGSNPARFWRKTSTELKVIGSRRRRYAAFAEFVDSFLNVSDPLRDAAAVEAYSHDLDMIIVGSDQIWNPRITGGIDHVYWGAFGRNPDTRIVSYAASMEDGFGDDVKNAVKQYLPSFTAVSVREAGLAARLVELDVLDEVSVVSDPVFLLNHDEWNAVSSPRLVSEPYLLFYQVRRSQKALNVAKEMAGRMNLRLVCLSAKVELENSDDAICASPSDFISLFRYADKVVTTSFHGTAFSVIYHDDFICVEENDGKGMRQKNLLDSLGLAGRLAGDFHIQELPSVSWEEVDSKVLEMRYDSCDFLKNCGL